MNMPDRPLLVMAPEEEAEFYSGGLPLLRLGRSRQLERPGNRIP